MNVLDNLKAIRQELADGKIGSKEAFDKAHKLLHLEKVGPPLVFTATTDLRRLLILPLGPQFDRLAKTLIDSFNKSLSKSHGIKL
jgi:hypothetical protein